jgi:glycosyltransferase involved in cell wall biosynthesis
MGTIMSNPEISVVIPSHNASQTIQRALKSVAIQTYSNYEIVIVDDGSTDNTKGMVSKFSEEFDSIQVKYITQSNLGPSSARNNGVQNSQGDFIAFLDADDEWHKNKLEMQIKIIKDKELNFLGSGYQYDSFDYGNTDKADMCTYSFNSLLLKNRFATSGVVIRKTFFLELQGFDENFKYAEDYDLWLRGALRFDLDTIESPRLIKRHRSVTGLSSHMFSMFKGELACIKKLLVSGNIGFVKYFFLNVFIFIKLLRRYFLNIRKQGI